MPAVIANCLITPKVRLANVVGASPNALAQRVLMPNGALCLLIKMGINPFSIAQKRICPNGHVHHKWTCLIQLTDPDFTDPTMSDFVFDDSFDFGEKPQGEPGAKRKVVAVKWEHNNVIYEDCLLPTIQYRNYFDTTPGFWHKHKAECAGVVGAVFWGEVGENTVKGNMLRFFPKKLISVPKPQQQTFDAVEVAEQLATTVKSIELYNPKPELVDDDSMVVHITLGGKRAVYLKQKSQAANTPMKNFAERVIDAAMIYDGFMA